MKNIRINNVANVLLVSWTFIWVYYALFNWDVFSIKLITNLGFSTITGYPFVFFFLLGIVLILVTRYFYSHAERLRLEKEKELNNKLILHEKDIEIMKLKEILFKMQNEEFNRNTTNLNELHDKLNNISNKLAIEEQQLESKDEEPIDETAST